MKKLILFPVIIIVVSTNAFAQNENKFAFSVGPELSIPTGSFSNTHSAGTGATVQAEYFVMEKLKATATFGVLAYFGNSSALTVAPLRIGAKYFLTPGFYGAAQLGVAFLGNYASTTGFAYSPLMLGYEFKTKSDRKIDASIKYDAYSAGSGVGTIGAFGVRLAYVF